MSYHKFWNLGEMFNRDNSDLSGKVMRGIIDFNLRDRDCNCDKMTLTQEQKCWFGDNCRVSMVTYELYCKTTGKSYFGKTQQYFKKRTCNTFKTCGDWFSSCVSHRTPKVMPARHEFLRGVSRSKT